METGTVKFFRVNEYGGFGFLDLKDGSTLYFRRNCGGPVAYRSTGNGQPATPVIETWEPVRGPREGDVIYFQRNYNRQGPMAAPWCFKEDWDQARLTHEDRRARDLIEMIGLYIEGAERLLGEDRIQDVALRLNDYLPKHFEELQTVTAAVERVTGTLYSEVVAQCHARCKALESKLQERRASIGQPHAARARDLYLRFQASLQNGNVGAAQRVLWDLHSGHGLKEGLALYLGEEQANLFFEQANSSLAQAEHQARERKAQRRTKKVRC